ncbi:MAG: LCP family protein [Candidatus Margulisiibacteriota bacterium]
MLKKYKKFDEITLRDICLLILAVIAIGIAVYFARNITVVDLMLTCLPQQEIADSPNILVSGIDATDIVRRSDTIMVFKVHDRSKKVNIISIPRDSYVYIPKHGHDKINHAYAYGGMPLLQVTLEEFMGMNIYRYIQLSLNDLRYIVNVLGGVDIDVEQRMYYVDKAGGLYIDLQPGMQRLNSEQAMGYIRYRHTMEGDIGRTRRQQKLISSIFNEVSKPLNVFKIPRIVTHLKKKIKTDLTLKEIIWLGARIKTSYEHHQFFQTTLAGREIYINGISYWEVDKADMKRVIDKALDPTEVKYEKHLKKFSKALKLKLEVLNGNGIPGSAEKIAHELKKTGVVISKIDNAANFDYPHTMLVVWDKKDSNSKLLGSYMGLSQQNIQDRNVQKKIYATIVLGLDWQEILENLKAQI